MISWVQAFSPPNAAPGRVSEIRDIQPHFDAYMFIHRPGGGGSDYSRKS